VAPITYSQQSKDPNQSSSSWKHVCRFFLPKKEKLHNKSTTLVHFLKNAATDLARKWILQD
jgi:hypothetical protein